MKILFTGGGSGGHFYPIIGIVEALHARAKEYRLLSPQFYYISTSPYNAAILFNNNIVFKKIFAGKIRPYFSVLNFFDIFKTAIGIASAIWQVFNIYPDVVFSKGGYASFPVLFAARILRIPIIIHESDSVPGKVNIWAGKFAKKIAVSYEEAAQFFPKEKVAHTGNPIRHDLLAPLKTGAREFLKLDPDVPVIIVLGGSLGAQKINDVVVDALPSLVLKYQVIHQTGKKNIAEVKGRAAAILIDSPHPEHYKPFDYLDALGMRMAAGAADIVVSRAGSAIFEIAAWGLPSILIPLIDSSGDHQKKNAFAYARRGACAVIEEVNLTSNILISEINRLMDNQKEREAMKNSAKQFIQLDAAEKIADVIIKTALSHEK